MTTYKVAFFPNLEMGNARRALSFLTYHFTNRGVISLRNIGSGTCKGSRSSFENLNDGGTPTHPIFSSLSQVRLTTVLTTGQHGLNSR